MKHEIEPQSREIKTFSVLKVLAFWSGTYVISIIVYIKLITVEILYGNTLGNDVPDNKLFIT